MADYQHVLAVHADVSRRKKRNWADVDPQFGLYYYSFVLFFIGHTICYFNIYISLEKRGLLDVDQEDLMILVPPLFSPKDIPEKLV